MPLLVTPVVVVQLPPLSMFNVVATVEAAADVPALLTSKVPALTFRPPVNGAARVLAPVLVIVLLAFRLPRPETVCPFRLTFLALTLLVASIDSGASIEGRQRCLRKTPRC